MWTDGQQQQQSRASANNSYGPPSLPYPDDHHSQNPLPMPSLLHSSPPHPHPQLTAEARTPKIAYDPVRPNGSSRSVSHHHETLHPTPQYDSPSDTTKRRSNPMAMTNILADDTSPVHPTAPPAPSAPLEPASVKALSGKTIRLSSSSHSQSQTHSDHGQHARRSTAVPKKAMGPPPLPQVQPSAARRPAPLQQGPPGLNARDTEAAWAEIQARDDSDVELDGPCGPRSKEEYLQARHKRTLEIEMVEWEKRKRRRTALMSRFQAIFSEVTDVGLDAFTEQFEPEIAEELRVKETEEDKERKKDQQRKRRREKAIADEQSKRQEVLQKLDTDDLAAGERDKLMKEVKRMDKKIQDTQSRLQGITPTKERNESPHPAAGQGRRGREATTAANGSITNPAVNNVTAGQDEGTPEVATTGRGGKRGGKGGTGGVRARKSKEQKQAEKDAAARAQAFLDSGQELPPPSAQEEERLRGYADKPVEHDESESDVLAAPDHMRPPLPTGIERFDTIGYGEVYKQIVRDVGKAVPKALRIKSASLDTKQANARKTAQLAAKEARRWQVRTNKSTKDVSARAKRAMREMLGFWKRNERDEREGRKAAERQELDRAKKAEAEREANRQKRKLNFLISQTELYSHFIGKKVKTDEIEKDSVTAGGVVPSQQRVEDDRNATNVLALPGLSGEAGTKVTNFEDLDFDADDETALQQAAVANAQNAIKEAQDRAREFNRKPGDDAMDMETAQKNFDDGELNFQNPTSLQNMDIAQPQMLSCQLKEYQLKGLNWLVNLYEQGINGILADEMGLGKTVQSISVMAYLAEMHDIWGPFLVIAPASTLHNWQQEITRFVPDIKVLPYWGSAKDRKILRKFWDRKHITYARESPFHVLVTSYQLVVQDAAYFQKVKWQYMILDEAQAIKSSQSSRWKSLLGFHCRNRLLLTGTPIQNNMQELWALLHFIMPSLFDSHDEFSEWFSKDIESHAQSNSKLNEDQLRRLHMILKPFMLRRVKKHVQKELGDKIEEDVFCDLTYRQRAYYNNLRNKISILDLIEKAAVGDDQDTASLMNLVMQFRKVCNHPDLFERAEIRSPLSLSDFAETASFMREGYNINVSYSVRSLIEFWLPTMLVEDRGRLDVAGPENEKAGWKRHALTTDLSIWDERRIAQSEKEGGAFAWVRFSDQSAGTIAAIAKSDLVQRAMELARERNRLASMKIAYDDFPDEEANAGFTPVHCMFNIVQRNDRRPLAEMGSEGTLHRLMNVSQLRMREQGYDVIECCYVPAASAPPVEFVCPSYRAMVEKETTFFSVPLRRALQPMDATTELALLQSNIPPSQYPVTNLLPDPGSQKQRFTTIQVPSMRRFVTDSGKLAKLDQLLRGLKEGGHRVLLYFQMTRMIDLMEEYLTYRNYKYCRLDGSTKLEDRRDTVAAFQSSPDIFVFLLSTRAGGLGINLTSADTVIFYDSDWNPTIDSQAMDRAHRLGQTRQVTVYRLITRGTIEERIRHRALQKEEVQRVVISGQAGASGNTIDFNSSHRPREANRTKEMAMWLADEDQAAAIERREAEVLEEEARAAAAPVAAKRKRKAPAKKKEVSMDDMYHEGVSAVPSPFLPLLPR